MNQICDLRFSSARIPERDIVNECRRSAFDHSPATLVSLV